MGVAVKWMIRTLHTVWHSFILARFFVRSFFIRLIARNPIKRRWLEIKNTTLTSRRFLRAFNVKLKIRNPERLQELKDQNYLLVGNHASFLDIFVLGAVENFVFITSVDMSETPVVGDVIRKAGCLYTDRKKPVSLPKEIQRFSATISEGFKVVLFPEGTSTDARSIKDFRASLFQVAIGARATILPVCISYQSVDGQPFGDNNRDTICWYGDMDFVPHFIGLLNHQIGVRVTILDPIPFDPNLSRAELSDLTREALLKTYHIDR